MRTITATTVGLLLAATAVTACSDSSDTSSSTYSQASESASSSPTETPTGTPTGGQTMDSNAADYATVAGDCGARPTLTVKTGAAAPTGLVVSDICEGDGATVAVGATVTAHYTGVGLATGKVFDSSWQRGEPIQFPLTGVIQGWADGIPGMKVGGRRLLVIPGALAYGQMPPPGSGIQPDETLVFIVDIVSSP